MRNREWEQFLYLMLTVPTDTENLGGKVKIGDMYAVDECSNGDAFGNET